VDGFAFLILKAEISNEAAMPVVFNANSSY
jgi:hypothetical protein